MFGYSHLKHEAGLENFLIVVTEMLQSLPVKIDLGPIIITTVLGLLAWFGTRSVKGIDTNFEALHKEVAEARVENKEKFTEVHSKIEKVNDETRSALTKHREKIDEKLDAHDERLRYLEKGSGRNV